LSGLACGQAPGGALSKYRREASCKWRRFALGVCSAFLQEPVGRLCQGKTERFVPTGEVRTVAGGGKAHVGGHKDCEDSKTTAMDGIGTDARFNYPWGIEFDSEENVLYVADCVSI